VAIAWLDVRPEVLKQRLEAREAAHTHFFPASLLGSQLEAAEPPDPNTEPSIVRIEVGMEPPDGVADKVWKAMPQLHPFASRP
jgi:gluconate kinase